MTTSSERPAPAAGPDGATRRATFLLTQLGEFAAQSFARRISELDLTPPQAGLLRLLARSPGHHQQEVARMIGMTPSRFVPFLDTLEQRGLVERRRNPNDRRYQSLYPTEAGRRVLTEIHRAAERHESEFLAALDPEEQLALNGLLGRVAAAQGLSSDIHPGFRRLDPDGESRGPADT
ncbi:MarR family winged helix-turn-helix transcriptional regulator [Streptomyces xiaopingdaonensis]|uniref:MarR family winged helix-turn-helix transcriptional regulator n=1 Tax=Streptomyces xiaopingdaonensis TaxID=1565415 RepID=UPI0002FD0A7A|nr:MarR family winged helix-turn-helix transcriptional regulator [Streptomyces xiaopingdaonensis]